MQDNSNPILSQQECGSGWTSPGCCLPVPPKYPVRLVPVAVTDIYYINAILLVSEYSPGFEAVEIRPTGCPLLAGYKTNRSRANRATGIPGPDGLRIGLSNQGAGYLIKAILLTCTSPPMRAS